ncbi:amino acid/polyamine transporter I [Tricharina praecox]|uniref:amino acid/polyamine transporter I n=1 Tax=Tricharina praecox TaxID=43433 RepID=UPI00221E7038|nr:amino acid/polyamine transporter I [Tricharina praecox]KAI5858127.1 amino acid/polyamine transporter I [Tricharina praecox]
MATIQDDDERMLMRIGYKQELRREFTRWSTVSYAISILGVLGSVPATFNVPIASGGPATAVWCWFFGSCMAMCIAASVSELVSAYPTAGGMYFVTKQVVPERHVPIWSWIVGWCNFLGQAAGVSSLAYSISQMLLAMISMHSQFDGDKYAFSPTALQTVLLALALLCAMGCVCSLTTRSLHKIVIWFAPINVLASIGICITLLVMTPNKHDAKWVFTHTTDGSGWGSKAFSFLLGFLSVAWTMTDYDGTTHMSEETHDAAIRGPVAINTAVVTSGLIGWMLTITFCFCLGDLESTIASPTGMPVAQIFLNAAGVRGATIMWSFVILIQFFTGISAMLACTRMAYAFSRDGAFPFSSFWSRINAKTHTPINSVWLVVGCCVCLDLIGLGSTQTIVGIFNITAPALDLSYVAVIFARIWYSDEIKFIDGPFTLGKYGRALNWTAITWVCFISVVLFFPPRKPVTPENMNYAICVAAFMVVFAVGWWWAGARDVYTGPRTKDVMDLVPSEDTEEEEEEEEETTMGYGTMVNDRV